MKVPPCGGPICALHSTNTSAPRAAAPTGAAPKGVTPTQCPIPSRVVSDWGHTNLPGDDRGMNSPLGRVIDSAAVSAVATIMLILATKTNVMVLNDGHPRENEVPLTAVLPTSIASRGCT